MDEVARCDALVASRRHGLLLAMVAWPAVLALSYDRKARALMENVEQGRQCREVEDSHPVEVARAEAGAGRERFPAMGRLPGVVKEESDRVLGPPNDPA